MLRSGQRNSGFIKRRIKTNEFREIDCFRARDGQIITSTQSTDLLRTRGPTASTWFGNRRHRLQVSERRYAGNERTFIDAYNRDQLAQYNAINNATLEMPSVVDDHRVGGSGNKMKEFIYSFLTLNWPGYTEVIQLDDESGTDSQNIVCGSLISLLMNQIIYSDSR